MAGDKYQFFIITLWPEESEIGVECTHCKGGGGVGGGTEGRLGLRLRLKQVYQVFSCAMENILLFA